MTRYVLGFLFNKKLNSVVLITKERPAWQRGRMNGVGGKIEEGETPLQAMNREFGEEAGIDLLPWILYGCLHGEQEEIFLFYAISDAEASTQEEEPISYILLEQLSKFPVLPNVPWMIQMALSLIIRGKLTCCYDIQEL